METSHNWHIVDIDERRLGDLHVAQGAAADRRQDKTAEGTGRATVNLGNVAEGDRWVGVPGLGKDAVNICEGGTTDRAKLC